MANGYLVGRYFRSSQTSRRHSTISRSSPRFTSGVMRGRCIQVSLSQGPQVGKEPWLTGHLQSSRAVARYFLISTHESVLILAS